MAASNSQPLDAESPRTLFRNKAIYYTAYLGTAVFLILAYQAYEISNWFVCASNLIGALICVYTGYAARNPNASGRYIYPFAFYLVAFVWYLFLSGYKDGVGVAWMMLVPVLALLALGTRIGATVIALQLPIIIYGFFFGDTISEEMVSPEVRARLFVVYIVSAVFCFVYSYAADRYERNLQQARERIVGLEKMLPVCSYCKNVRFNGGWGSIESYLAGQSDLQVSEGVCPDCLQDHVAK